MASGPDSNHGPGAGSGKTPISSRGEPPQTLLPRYLGLIFPGYAYDILTSSDFPRPIAQMILEHHEKLMA